MAARTLRPSFAQVAKYALNVVWYQKWVVHLRHRPEAGAGLVHLINLTCKTFDATPWHTVFSSDALKHSHDKYKTFLLSQSRFLRAHPHTLPIRQDMGLSAEPASQF